jgi:hypothetical protein
MACYMDCPHERRECLGAHRRVALAHARQRGGRELERALTDGAAVLSSDEVRAVHEAARLRR